MDMRVYIHPSIVTSDVQTHVVMIIILAFILNMFVLCVVCMSDVCECVGGAVHVWFVNEVIIRLITFFDFGRRLVGGSPLCDRPISFLLSLLYFGRRLVGGVLFLLSLSDFGRRLVGGRSAAYVLGWWRSFLVGAGVPLVGLLWEGRSMGWVFGRVRSVFKAVFENVVFWVFFVFVSFGVRGNPSRGSVGVRGSGSVFVRDVVEGPSREVSAWVRGSGSVGLRGLGGVSLGGAEGKTFFIFFRVPVGSRPLPPMPGFSVFVGVIKRGGGRAGVKVMKNKSSLVVDRRRRASLWSAAGRRLVPVVNGVVFWLVLGCRL